MAALNSTVASVPAPEYVSVLTDANARTGKRGEGGGEVDINVLGAYGRDVLNENGKLLLGLAGRSSANFFAPPIVAFSTPRAGPTAGRTGQTRLYCILTKGADRRLVRCVNVRRRPSDVPEPNHNLCTRKSAFPADPVQTGGGRERRKL